MSRVLSLLLCLVLVLAAVPAAETSAKSGYYASINFGTPKLTNKVLTFPNLTVTSNFEATNIIVTVSDGSIKSTGYSNADILTEHKTATWLFSSPKNQSALQNFIRELEFNFVSGMKITFSFDGNVGNNIPAGATVTTLHHADGTDHYYMYVPYGSKVNWPTSYNAAKQYVYKGLRGYLATVTQVEEDKVLDNLYSGGAWAGAAQVPLNFTALDAMTCTGYCPLGTGTAETKWVWSCGPEAGHLVRFRSDSTDLDDPTIHYLTAPAEGEYYYSNWNVNEPNNSGGAEWTMEVHFGTSGENGYQGAGLGWNDYPDTVTENGFFVEFSEYATGYADENYSPDKKATGTFDTHVHDWTLHNTNKRISATCETTLPFGCAGNDGISLMIDIDPDKKVNQNPITITGLTEWTALGLPAGTFSYVNAATPDATPSALAPTSAGTYIVTYTVVYNGEPFSISREYTVEADQTVDAEEVLETGGHQHVWDIKTVDKTMTIACIGNRAPKCKACGETYTVELVINESAGPNGNYAYLNETGSKDVKKIIPKRTLTYTGIDGTTYGPSKTKPTASGTYRVTLECDGVKIAAQFTITNSGTIANVKEIYCYRYPGKGINRGGGFIDYTPREDVLNYAYDSNTNEQVKGIYINMTKEKLVSDFAYDCYTTDGGKKWVKGKLDDAKLAKAFSRRTNIRLSDKYDEKTKKPAEGATQYYFNTINKRAAATTLKPDYQLYMDPYGITNGQWTLLKVTTEVNLYQYYEIGIAEGKKLGKQGFGIWPDAGGVWVPELTKAGKNQKVLYFYRTRATVDTPASKTKKVKISGVLAPTKFKADYKKEILKLKKGASLFFGDSIPNLYEVPYDFENNLYLGTETKVADFDGKFLKGATDAQAKGINIADYLTSDRNTIHVWINATGSKPATKVQMIVLAARGVISAEKNLKCEKGNIILEKGKDISYEFYDEAAQKWVATVPAVTASANLRCRVKCNVKGGKENGKNYATGIEGVCEITWGVVDAKSGKEGIVSALLKPSN